MHVEVQVALNFLISFLYNKLPRRRVNQFGEELEATLKTKFEGHWYPEQPYKGSAFRCIRCAPPLDPFVFEVAARNSGMNLLDIQENLPQELSIWVDPGEVSYRISEKGPVKILFSERGRINDTIAEPPVSGLNPEAQCFKPIEHLASVLPNLAAQSAPVPLAVTTVAAAAVTPLQASKNSHPVTFTTATFAATKFGSTKLKTNGKKGQRSSPTDFGLFMKPKSSQVLKDCNGQWANRNRTGVSPFGNNLDLLDLSDIDVWKTSSTTPTYTSQLTNIWAAKPQMSPGKVDSQCSANLFESDSLFAGSEPFDPLRHHFPSSNSDSSTKNETSPPRLGLLDNSRLSLLSERLWDEIFSISPESYTNAPASESNTGTEQASTRNDPFFCSSFSLSSVSSSNESCSLNLVNEFDNLSLNSSSSSSVGSASSSSSSSSYIT